MTAVQDSLARILTRSLRLPKALCLRLRHRGVVDTGRWVMAGVGQCYRDWKLGLDTRGESHGSILTDNISCNAYTPIGAACFETVMRHVGASSDDVFLDYGSGKGRAILLAARHRFRKCIGVELSGELCDIARLNLSRSRSRLHCRDIEVIESDATTFQIPSEVSVIFLFNPFVGQVLQRVIDQIRESLRASPRELRIAYIYPADEVTNLFEPCDWLTKVYEERIGVSTDQRFVIYRSQISGRN